MRNTASVGIDARRLALTAAAIAALAALSGCGSDPPGGALTLGADVSDNVTSTDPARTGPGGAALVGDPHQDAWTVTFEAGHSYVVQVCPVHGGWDPVVNVVRDGASASDDFEYCQHAGQSSPETCLLDPAAGAYTVYVGSYDALTDNAADKGYTLRVAEGSSATQSNCPPLQ